MKIQNATALVTGAKLMLQWSHTVTGHSNFSALFQGRFSIFSGNLLSG